MKPVLVFVLCALGALTFALGFVVHRQDRRIRELEAGEARRSSPEGAAELLRRAGIDPSQAPDPAAQEASSAAARKAAELAVAERAEALERRLESLEKNAVAASGGGDPALIDELVSKKVDEKMEGQKEKKGGLFGEEKKRPLADISKDLALSELQEDQMAETINASQKKCFDVITTPRNDGTNVLDDLVKALQDPVDTQEKATAAFMKIFTDKIPGTDETYLARIMTEKKALNEEFGKILTPEQMKKYSRLGQDPHEITTGYDPYGEYMAERMGKK